MVERKVKGLTNNVKSELVEFARLLGTEQSSALQTMKSEIISRTSEMVDKTEKQLMEEIGNVEKRLEAKMTKAIEDALSRGTFQYVTSDPLDSLVGENITIITQDPVIAEPLQPCSSTYSETGKQQLSPMVQAVQVDVLEEPPAKRMKASDSTPSVEKRSTSKKYTWKTQNPKGEAFITESCAAVKFRRNQSVKEKIFDEGVKRELWADNDAMFLKVCMKVDSTCKNAH